jgi:hypothetical protein
MSVKCADLLNIISIQAAPTPIVSLDAKMPLIRRITRAAHWLRSARINKCF